MTGYTTRQADTPAPFSARTVLALLLCGALAFVAVLYFIGAGATGGRMNDGGGHAGGKGLNGYAGLARMLEDCCHDVVLSRSQADWRSAGLLVLTPSHQADGPELAGLLGQRRGVGPTLVIFPKWMAWPAKGQAKGAKAGWVLMDGASAPGWMDALPGLGLETGAASGWRSGTLSGTLPAPDAVQAALPAPMLRPLVTSGDGTRILAAEVTDPDWPRTRPHHRATDHPLILVFEPDLLDNYGLAHRENALLANGLFHLASGGGGLVLFDLSLNGLGHTPNLLTLAFTPPFLAATLCLLLAGAAVAWRGFARFGPPATQARALAFGKSRLVRNSAGLILRTGRLHLLGAPYAAMMRARIAKLLGLRPGAETTTIDHAIDQRLAARALDAPPFSAQAETLGHARKPAHLLHAARALRKIERTLQS